MQPKYYVITNVVETTEYYSVECDEGSVVEWLESSEVAKAIAMLCCLGHIRFNEKQEMVVTSYPEGDPISFTHDEDDYEDDQDDDAMADDDGPAETADSSSDSLDDDGYEYSADPQPPKANRN